MFGRLGRLALLALLSVAAPGLSRLAGGVL